MAGAILRFLGTTLFFLCISAAAAAAPPTGSPTHTPERQGVERPSRLEELKTLGIDRRLASFAGTVLDMNERPIPNVRVQLFVEGQLVASSVTEPTGLYDLRAAYDPSDDVTVLLWFVAPDRSIMPKELVIQESRASKANGLISRCVPRASLTPGHRFRVYLFDHASRNKELAESDCLP
jgi:hypothetical protein